MFINKVLKLDRTLDYSLEYDIHLYGLLVIKTDSFF